MALPLAGGLFVCAQAQTQTYPREKNGLVLAEGRAQPATQSVLSAQAALQKAETLAQLSLLEHGISKAITLPPAWEDLRDDITRELLKTYSLKTKLTGVNTVSRDMLPTGASCVLSIPAANLRQAVAATAAQWNENSILRDIRPNAPLHFEAAARIGKPPDIKELLNASTDILQAIAEGRPIGRLPKLWQLAKDTFQKQPIATKPADVLLAALDETIGRDDLSALILEELSRRNRAHVARRLACLKFPRSGTFALEETGLAELKTGALAELNNEESIAGVIVRHDGLLLFKENAAPNENLARANAAFSQAPVDFDKVRDLALQSLLEQTTAEAFNLIGRTHELQDKPGLAAFFYFQAHVINNQNPHAATNLALVLDKLGNKKHALLWLREASKNDRLPPWSKQKLDILRAKYRVE
jgi:tetratricopeptide (TPR) repeat protein